MIQHGKFVVFHQRADKQVFDYSIELVVVKIDVEELEEVGLMFGSRSHEVKKLKPLWRLLPSNPETFWWIVCIKDKIYRFGLNFKKILCQVRKITTSLFSKGVPETAEL